MSLRVATSGGESAITFRIALEMRPRSMQRSQQSSPTLRSAGKSRLVGLSSTRRNSVSSLAISTIRDSGTASGHRTSAPAVEGRNGKSSGRLALRPKLRVPIASSIDYLVEGTGHFDLMAEVVCSDQEHLRAILQDRVRTIRGVRSVESFVFLALLKEIYDWGVG